MTETPGGFYDGMARAEYDALPASFLNFSRLKYLERSPLAFRYHCDNPTEPTAPMILGNAAHLAILEPSMAEFAVWTEGRRFGKKYDEWCELHAGCTQLNQKEYDYVQGMVTAVHANPYARKYLKRGRSELTMIWRDMQLKRDFKARIDWETIIDGEPFLVSLKSTVDCRDFRFSSQYHKMCYHVQDAIYQNGYFYRTGTLPRMVTIAVESKPPHETAVYTIPSMVATQGNDDLTKWIRLLGECEKLGRWPAAVEGEQELVLPAWAYPGGDFEMSDLEPIAR
jgi:hypothetical protein